VSFRAITNADVLCNQGTGPLRSDTKVLWSGTNAFRLNNATNTATINQTYTFAPGTATNFARLELVNSSTYRNGNVTIGNGGTLLVASNGNVIASNLTMAAGSALAVTINATNNYSQLALQGAANTLNGSLLVTLNSAPPDGSSYPIAPGAVTGTFTNTPITGSYLGTNYIFAVNYAGGVTLQYNKPGGKGTTIMFR